MDAQLRRWRPGPREVFDLLAGAVDAHVHPQWSRRRRRGRGALAVALGVLAAALASQAVLVALGALGAAGAASTPAALAALWLAAALGLRRLGSRQVTAFSALVGLRFAADWTVLPAAAGLAHTGVRGLAVGLAASAAEVALLGILAAVLLRRAGWRWAAALALACTLELGLGGGLSLSTLLPGSLEPLRVAAWAALLTWLAAPRRRPRPWGEPPEGAPVPARPVPDPPEPLAARARRAG
jgi:hypothetical protein